MVSCSWVLNLADTISRSGWRISWKPDGTLTLSCAFDAGLLRKQASSGRALERDMGGRCCRKRQANTEVFEETISYRHERYERNLEFS